MAYSDDFATELGARNNDPAGRRWLFVPYDQLSDAIGPLSHEDPAELGIVLVESPAKAAKRPYHRQKLALVLTNLRHFALEQAERGVSVKHLVHDGSYAEAVERVLPETGPLRCMEPAERELRLDLAPLVESGGLESLPHEGWLTTKAQFEDSQKRGAPWRMEAFYRHVRKATGLLMEDGKPAGGKLSHDADNRKPWKGDPTLPSPPVFQPDRITLEVAELIEQRFSSHPGALDLDSLPASRRQAESLWIWAKSECLEHFGTYEDAMTTQSATLFHTRVSALMHLHRLLPRDIVRDVVSSDAPLNSREGFLRQVLGWREFMRHVHAATEGFTQLPDGFQRDFLDARRPLPQAFWGSKPSGLHCLDTVVDDVWRDGYGHHITRLMVLSNLATLLDVSPDELTEWFWVAYADAYDWVVEPNVLGMGTFSLGELFTTKPYVSGSAYIDRMGDYCGDCAFHPKKSCPWTRAYWAFLGRHAERLRGNPRVAMPLRSLAKRSPEQRQRDERAFERLHDGLGAGQQLDPDAFTDAGLDEGR